MRQASEIALAGSARSCSIIRSLTRSATSLLNGSSVAASPCTFTSADRAFAADAKARGADGWFAAFDPHGAMMHNGERIEGDAIRDEMFTLLLSGTLAWDPIASGVDGELGFTVGKATYTPQSSKTSWASTYVTIWHHQPDGSWKVLFDTGRVVNR